MGLLALGSPGPTRAEPPSEDASPSPWTRLAERTRIGLDGDLEWAGGWNQGPTQKGELRLAPHLRMDLAPGVVLRARGRARADGWDQLERGQPRQKTRSDASRRGLVGDRIDAELRELTLELSRGGARAVLGKQQIVWGRADGLKVLDVVNPQSFREFILEDFDESRIPLWSVNLEAPLGPVSVQGVWIPDKTYHDFVDEGVFAFSSDEFAPPPPPGIRVEERNAERPTRFFEDSDAGLAVRGFAGGWDWSLHYLYHYDDVPGLFAEPGLRDGEPVLVVTPRYERTHLVGLTASNAFGDWVLRTEVVYSSRRLFATESGDGVGRAGELQSVVGLDWYGLPRSLVSLQVFPGVLLRDVPGLRRDRVDGFVTLFVQHRMLQERLRLEGTWLANWTHGDGLLRPRITLAWSDYWSVYAGADIFYGSRNGAFGQFDQADRVVLGVEWPI